MFNINSNYLLYGENLAVLKHISSYFVDKVQCVFIDPPYNTHLHSLHFNDSMESEDWLNNMKERLIILRSLLNEKGSIWISINDCQLYSLKHLCDEVFLPCNFLGTVVWEKGNAAAEVTSFVQEAHDYILIYAKDKQASKQEIQTKFKYSTVWKKEEVGSSAEALEEAISFNGGDIFTTSKPERLVSRVIEIASEPNDLVLDCYGGSGTTAAVAQKMKRKWILIENQMQCHTHIIPRLDNVISGKDKIGITSTVNWQGGGEYTYNEHKHA